RAALLERGGSAMGGWDAAMEAGGKHAGGRAESKAAAAAAAEASKKLPRPVRSFFDGPGRFGRLPWPQPWDSALCQSVSHCVCTGSSGGGFGASSPAFDVDPDTGMPPPKLLATVAWGFVAGDVHRVVAGSGAGKDVLASITPERCRVRYRQLLAAFHSTQPAPQPHPAPTANGVASMQPAQMQPQQQQQQQQQQPDTPQPSTAPGQQQEQQQEGHRQNGMQEPPLPIHATPPQQVQAQAQLLSPQGQQQQLQQQQPEEQQPHVDGQQLIWELQEQLCELLAGLPPQQMALVQAGLGQQQQHPNGIASSLTAGFGLGGVGGVTIGPEGAQYAPQRQQVADLAADLMPGEWPC
ncbi:hypothetical protein DUNSADRAFT_13883, partial [Dunaliella salina]